MKFFNLIFLFFFMIIKLTNSFIPSTLKLNLLKYAQISENVYTYDDTKVDNTFKINEKLNCNMKMIKYFNFDNNLGCMIIKDDVDKNLIISFKGTTKIIDWKYNFDFKLKSLNKIKLHSGYYNMICDSNILSILKDEIYNLDPNYNINLCGHSAGGAKSIITSYYLANTFKNRKFNVYTYGCPRVGDINFTKRYNNLKNTEHYRVSYKNDIVTAFPFYKYHHLEKSFRLRRILNKDKKYVNIIDNSKYNKLYTFSLFKCNNVFDHNIANYVNFLTKSLED